jgi:hypothetical protein
VIEKSDEYDDGNWHAEQPEQYSAAHERLLVIPFLIPVNGQASVSFQQITPLRQIIYAGNQVRLTTEDRSAGRLARGGPSDSRVEISEVLLTAPATLFTDFLIASFA